MNARIAGAGPFAVFDERSVEMQMCYSANQRDFKCYTAEEIRREFPIENQEHDDMEIISIGDVRREERG